MKKMKVKLFHHLNLQSFLGEIEMIIEPGKPKRCERLELILLLYFLQAMEVLFVVLISGNDEL